MPEKSTMGGGQNIRAFLAIDPPDEVRQSLGRIQDRLKKTVDGPVRWAAPAGIHLTLKFFGDILPEDVARISEAVAADVAGIGPLSLEIKTLGVFPDSRRPRIIWLGTTGDADRLQMLQGKLDRSFGKLGFPQEDRPFRPHWTLARIKTPTGVTGLPRALETGQDLSAGKFTAEKIVLFRSELQPKGAVYTKLAEYPLKG